jgi:hypothetical protein
VQRAFASAADTSCRYCKYRFESPTIIGSPAAAKAVYRRMALARPMNGVTAATVTLTPRTTRKEV